MEPYEIIAGPFTLWLAPVGTAFPALGAAPAAGWVKVGTNGDASYADDGVTVSTTQKIDQARPAGTTGPVKAWRSEEDLMIGLTLWDMTLEQVTAAINGAAVTTTAPGAGTPGRKTIGLTRGHEVKTYALLARGPSAYGPAFTAQYEVPRCYQSANAKAVHKKGTPAGVELEFTALENLAAASPAERFGRLVSQHAAAV